MILLILTFTESMKLYIKTAKTLHVPIIKSGFVLGCVSSRDASASVPLSLFCPLLATLHKVNHSAFQPLNLCATYRVIQKF
jgi:hypothetical protein